MATVLCLGMTTAVMAAPSAGTGTVSPDVDNTVVAPTPEKAPSISANTTVEATKVVDANGDEIANAVVEVKAVNDEVKATYSEAQKDTLAKIEALTEAQLLDVIQQYDSKATGKTIDMSAVIVKDIECSVAGTIHFEIPGVKMGEKYTALHVKDNGQVEALPVEVIADGVVAITFTSYSPVFFTQLLDVKPAPAPYYPPAETQVAPKTADVAMFGMVAMAALAGTVTAARKAKESK